MAFRVLSVCTGNICRSPMCERLLFARTRGAGVDLVSVSAGTHGLAGYAMDAPSAAVLRELGSDPNDHVASRLRHADIDGADLVLTATADHRAFTVGLAPNAARRIFTMREFGRLADPLPPLDDVSDEALRSRVRSVAARRSAASSGRQDDIGDPFGGSVDETRRIGLQVSDAVEAIVGGLGMPPLLRPPPLWGEDGRNAI